MVGGCVALFLLFSGYLEGLRIDGPSLENLNLRKVIAASILPALTFVTPLDARCSTTSVESFPIGQSEIRRQENFLPRKLYPGTYKNFCGPTPEVSPTNRDECRAHGWHGDDALDEVDAACRLHDIKYCECEGELLSRLKRGDQRIPLLSPVAALRFVTNPVLKAEGVDSAYLKCINRADRELIATGIRIRGEQQRTDCKGDGLDWFCKPEDNSGTLAAFEKVSLSIFLKDLDADEMDSMKPNGHDSARTPPLSQMEGKRHADLMDGIRRGKKISDAASSGTVQKDEERMLIKLATD